MHLRGYQSAGRFPNKDKSMFDLVTDFILKCHRFMQSISDTNEDYVQNVLLILSFIIIIPPTLVYVFKSLANKKKSHKETKNRSLYYRTWYNTLICIFHFLSSFIVIPFFVFCLLRLHAIFASLSILGYMTFLIHYIKTHQTGFRTIDANSSLIVNEGEAHYKYEWDEIQMIGIKRDYLFFGRKVLVLKINHKHYKYLHIPVKDKNFSALYDEIKKHLDKTR